VSEFHHELGRLADDQVPELSPERRARLVEAIANYVLPIVVNVDHNARMEEVGLVEDYLHTAPIVNPRHMKIIVPYVEKVLDHLVVRRAEIAAQGDGIAETKKDE
jgi:hypothetical protein